MDAISQQDVPHVIRFGPDGCRSVTTLPRACRFRVEAPADVEVRLYGDEATARFASKAPDVLIPARDGTCWLIRASELSFPS